MEDMKLSKKIKAIMKDLGIDLENCKNGNCKICPFEDADTFICDFLATMSALERLENVAEKYVFKSDLAKDLKVDDPILVGDDGNYWIKAHFAKFENGMFYVWEHGCTSFTAVVMRAHKFAKLPKREFDWEEFENKQVAVHCKTEELAKDFLRKTKKQGFAWAGGDELTKMSEWEKYKKNTCYDARKYEVQYGEKSWYEQQQYKIIDWEDYI